MLVSGTVRRALTSRDDGTRTHALGAVLLLRAAVHGVFGWWIFARHPAWGDIFAAGAICGIVDGNLGLIAAAICASFAPQGGPRLLASITVVDALGRLVVGVALVTLPGVMDFPVTAASLFGALGACLAGLGVIAVIVWLVARIRGGQGWSFDRDALFDPLAAAALIAFVLAGVLVVDPPANAAQLRTVAVSVCGALTIALAISAAGAFAFRGDGAQR